ncbi:MAG TPA: glycosyltransferase, partial [Gemmatimonadales bacterium]|nr:glycosyltransferase [Gemmatimonadales bacterium]
RDHAQSDGTLRLVYLGNVERSRGLHLVIDAMGLLGPTIPVRLDVFGAGSSLEVDQARARELGLDDRIRFRGRVPYDEVLDCLHEFDVGLIPHHATDHWNYTIQNKFFDYMMAGLPLLVSSMAPAARMVGEIESGLVFRDRDPNDLAARIRELMEPSIRARMGAAGRAGVEREHHWGRDATRLVASLEAQGRGPAAARRGPPEPEPRPGPR